MPSGGSTGSHAHAPGRVNLIGDHTDYNDGLALPMAIDLGVDVEYRPSGDDVLVIETDLGPARAEVPRAMPALDALEDWARLAGAVIAEIGPAEGGHLGVRSDLPARVGLASSAAFAVALALALGADPEPTALARLCQRAERAIGVPVGLMDPLVSMSARNGRALLIDFTDASTELVAVPEAAEVVIVDSGTARTLEGSPYADRRCECEAAAAVIGQPLGRANRGDLDRISDPLLRRRARHVITEVERVRAFAEAISHGQFDVAGDLMVRSHRSLSEDFDVSTPLLDRLVASVSAVSGVHGARLTGAGFGGCVVALCRPGTELALPNRTWPVRPAAGAWVRAL